MAAEARSDKEQLKREGAQREAVVAGRGDVATHRMSETGR